TTRLCLALLVELEQGGQAAGPIADWGTGSGVLAVAAAKLGWAPVSGCDREEASLETARANAEVNGVELALERLGGRGQRPPVARTGVANLTGNLLQDCAGHLAVVAERPETMVCSGMLESEIDEVAGAFASAGLAEARRISEHEWGALLLRGGETG